MKRFEQEMAEKAGVVTMKALEINALTTEFRIDVHYVASINVLELRVHNNKQHVICRHLGKHRVYYILSLNTILTREDQEHPYHKDCTLDQMISVLHQIKQALTEDHSKEKAA